jgi:hypothetical protein
VRPLFLFALSIKKRATPVEEGYRNTEEKLTFKEILSRGFSLLVPNTVSLVNGFRTFEGK